MAFLITDLPDFTQVNKEEIIRKIVLEGSSIARMTKQTGIKKDAAINYLEVNPEFQDGAACGFSAKGDTTLTQRTISTGAIKVNLEWCPETLLGKYAEYLVEVSAREGQALPFEEYILEVAANRINEKLEKAIYFGDTGSTDEDLKRFDGLVKIAKADSDTVKVTVAENSTHYDAVKQVLLSIPEDIADRAAIFVSPAFYRGYLQELVEKNYFHYVPNAGAGDEIVIPGSDVKLVKTPGLATTGATKYIIAADPKELVYGCDLENAREIFDVWYSKDADTFRLKALWNSGVQYMFSDRFVLGSYTTLK